MATRSLNKVILIGHLGSDPEFSHIPSGAALAKFSLATNESWKDQSGQAQERVEWHRIIAWARLAEICNEYLKKGRRVYIEGRIQTRSYDDKEGIKRYTTEIVATDMIMLDGGEGRATGGADRSAPDQSQAPRSAESQPVDSFNSTSDLPF